MWYVFVLCKCIQQCALNLIANKIRWGYNQFYSIEKIDKKCGHEHLNIDIYI